METIERNAMMSIGQLFNEVGDANITLTRLPMGMVKITMKKEGVVE